MPHALVIGCGVSGLSTAIRLLENDFSVNIITREMPQETTSVVAGAIWYGGTDDLCLRKWAKTSLKIFQNMAKDNTTGVHITRMREYYPHAAPELWFKDDIPYFESISTDEIPEQYESGYVIDIPLVQTPAYMDYLLRRFYALGGTIEEREIQSLSELSDKNHLIINCTGVYARHVVDDERVYPILGQVLLVDAPQISESFMDDESFTYIFPRKDGVILGGVAIPNQWERIPEPTITEDILMRCEKIYPDIRQAKIIKTLVGLRPGRHEIRLEPETISANCTVIHNYGHGSLGFTFSWGCAETVLALAKRV
jgi:D-amino-acid oxidase